MENLIFVFLSAFIVYSLVQISILLQQFFVKDAYCIRSFVVIALSGEMKNIEFMIRKYMLKYSLDNKTQVMFIDVGLDSQSRFICEKFCKNHSGVFFCRNSQVYSILESALKI